jgi:hypothetical protein
MLLVGFSTGTFAFWRQEAFLRRLSETIVFLHHRAVADQAFYRLDFSFKPGELHAYKVGVLRAEELVDERFTGLASQAGILSVELAAFLHPSLGKTQTLIPPPKFPSLAEPVEFPPDVVVEDVRTMRGVHTPGEGGTAYVLFSPRGFSEFCIVHLKLARDKEAQVTILVNPFTGNTEIYRKYKDFEWVWQGDRT